MSNGNEMAYPVPATDHHNIQPGLTKRELFAAMAMQGLCAADSGFEEQATQIAEWAVFQADALLAQLAKPAEPPAIVPWTKLEQVPLRSWYRNKLHTTFFPVIGVNSANDGVKIDAHGWVSLGELFADFEHSPDGREWHPCGTPTTSEGQR